MDGVEVVIPGGFERQGRWQRSVWLRPLCGRDEVFLCEEGRALPPAARTTALLARCLALEGEPAPAGAGFSRALSAGDREALLLHLRRITFGDSMTCVLVCPACGEKLEVDLSVSDLVLQPYQPEGGERVARLGGLTVRFRLPTGGDLEAALPLVRGDPAAAEREVLRRSMLSVTDEQGSPIAEVPGAVFEDLPALMAELDPQAEVALEARCPACDQGFTGLLDAAQYLEAEVVQSRDRLYREVHLLASQYHWSEPEILSLTARQRRRYAELAGSSTGGAG
jgi:hypothetical protein